MTQTATIRLRLDQALVQAASEGDTDLAQKLISLGADVHCFKETPLRQAASHCHLETVKALRACGAQVGRAIFAAAEDGSADEVMELLNCAPDVLVVSTLRAAMSNLPQRPSASPKPPNDPKSPAA